VAVSVVIPTLNEEDRIGATIDAARAAGAAEIVVADGGSTDRTVAVAQGHGARVINVPGTRAAQLNGGAAMAAHDAVIFLHADTHLPPSAASAVERAIHDGARFGGFRLTFLEPGLRLRWVAFMINARTQFTRAPWGDQAQFVARGPFLADGGYRDLPIMEDYELARRMKRAGGTSLLPLTVRTSGRRFLQKGVLRSSALNWLIIVSYHLGVSPQRLAQWYRG
jgi:rSAM/selenodomain-associated transferase 2